MTTLLISGNNLCQAMRHDNLQTSQAVAFGISPTWERAQVNASDKIVH